jgi:hypothetical protein
MSSASLLLDPRFVDAVARRVAELLEPGDPRVAAAEGGGHTSASLTVAQVAARYRVSRSWVYAHQRELGAMRLGHGPRARLRFDAQMVADGIAAFDAPNPAEEPPSRRGQGREVPLIPFEPMD